MWIAIRPFRYRGHQYQAGDEVPAETWPARRALVSRRRIRLATEDPTDVSKSQMKAMSRAELNLLATQLGIVDAESYPNREALTLAINGEEAPVEDDDEEVIVLDDTDDEDSESEDSQEDESDDDEDDDE